MQITTYRDWVETYSRPLLYSLNGSGLHSNDLFASVGRTIRVKKGVFEHQCFIVSSVNRDGTLRVYDKDGRTELDVCIHHHCTLG